MRKTWKTWLCSILCLGMILQSGAFNPIISSAEEAVTQTAEEGKTVIYVNENVVSAGDGASAGTAVKTLDEAYALLPSDGTMDENIIVI